MNPSINIQSYPTAKIWIGSTDLATADSDAITADRTDHTADEEPHNP